MAAPIRPATRPVAPSRLLAAACLLLLAAGSWWTAAGPAEAATTHTVKVVADEDGGFSPRTITVRAGDTVRWTWVVEDSRTISFEDDPSKTTGCVQRLVGCKGEERIVEFDEVGRFEYVDRADGMPQFPSTVIVEAAASPSPSDDPTALPTRPSPTDDPTSQPEPSPSETDPSPTETSSPSPSPSPSPSRSSRSPSPSSSSPTPQPDPTTGTAVPVAVESESTSPSPTPTPAAPSVAGEDRSVPVPSPSFQDFPEASDPAAGDVEGTVAIDTPDDGGTSRTVWGLLGGVSVLGTLGAFGRRVLFSDPWDAS